MRLWSLLAVSAIVGSSIIWLKAAKYSFRGAQMWVARIFLAVDWGIVVLKIIALFYAELAPKEAQTAATASSVSRASPPAPSA